jgi:hypothetical protein
MPAGRIGVAAAALRRWCEATIGPDDVLIAWDEESAAVAAETSQPIGVILDGLSGGAAARTMSMVLDDRHVSLIVASADVQAAVGVEAPGAAPAAIPPPAAPVASTADETLRVHVAAEPMYADQCRQLVPFLGRIRLLGRPVRVRVAGTPEHIMPVADMLAAVGVDETTSGPPDGPACCVRQGDLVWCGGAVAGSQVVLPVGPALAAWAAGAVVLLPSGHPAEAVLGACDGALLHVDTDPDTAVRQLDASLEASRVDRTSSASAWFDALLEGVSAAVTRPRVPA